MRPKLPYESRKCTRCGKIGHTKTRCYKIIGYPENWEYSRDIRKKTCNQPTVAVGVADRAAAASPIANAGDPDILSDFILPPNTTTVDGNFFTFTGMRLPFHSDQLPKNFTVAKAALAEFPALNGQSVSYAVLTFAAGAVNPPHTHPRASELLFLIGGNLTVGFIDTTNKLYTQSLQSGDMFVFPKGLVHFQLNSGNDTAVALSAFGSASAGLVSVPAAVFSSGIDDGILAKSFKTDAATVQMIKAGLAPKA